MNFPRFWAKATQGAFTCWGWSDRALSEAQVAALEAARKLAERFTDGKFPTEQYGYPDRPLREPVLREFKDGQGGLTAVMTRNTQGCMVLNTARLMFVDVDLPAPKASGGLFSKLFGKPQPVQQNPEEARALERAQAWAQSHPGWGWRAYRTRAGLRLMATHAELAPETSATEAVFDALQADPLYRRLCKTQKSFRARLTPKPWRCNTGNPPSRWPWDDAKAEAKFAKWEANYLTKSAEHATCEFIATYGNERVHADFQALVRFHDEATRATSELALA